MVKLVSIVGDFHSAEKTHLVLSCLKATGERRTHLSERGEKNATNLVYAYSVFSVVWMYFYCSERLCSAFQVVTV